MSIPIFTNDSETIIYVSADFSRRMVSKPIDLVTEYENYPIIAVGLFNEKNQYRIPDDIIQNGTITLKFVKNNWQSVLKNASGISSDHSIVYFEVDENFIDCIGSYKVSIEIKQLDMYNNEYIASAASIQLNVREIV